MYDGHQYPEFFAKPETSMPKLLLGIPREYTSSELVFMSQLDPIWIKSVTDNFDVLAEAIQEREEI